MKKMTKVQILKLTKVESVKLSNIFLSLTAQAYSLTVSQCTPLAQFFLLEAVIVFSITIQHKVSQLANVVHRRCGQGYCGRAQAAACCGGFGQLRGIRPANKQ